MKNVNDLRGFLLKTITEVKAGTLEVPKAQAICALSNSIINITKLEMVYNASDVGVGFMNTEELNEDDDLEDTMREIEEKNKQPYVIGQ